MFKMKIVSSTLLEVVVALTLVLVILTMTFTVFLNVYRSSLTLPIIQNDLYLTEAMNQTIKEKKYISFAVEFSKNVVYQEVKDTANGLCIVELRCDSAAKYNEKLKIWVIK
jgi:hypothetical protein